MSDGTAGDGEIENETSGNKSVCNGVLSCSFCGKEQERVKQLIKGPGVNICNECILLCTAVLFDELAEKTERLNEIAR